MPEPNWNTINNFGRQEFPEGIWERLDAALIPAVDRYRDRLGFKLRPTPLQTGFIRLNGSPSSRHYALTRLSDAGDFFPEGELPHAFEVAVKSGLFGGIGIYWDTWFRGQPWGMVHLDLRPGPPIWWARVEDPDGVKRYINPGNGGADRTEFYALLATNELKPGKIERGV